MQIFIGFLVGVIGVTCLYSKQLNTTADGKAVQPCTKVLTYVPVKDKWLSGRVCLELVENVK